MKVNAAPAPKVDHTATKPAGAAGPKAPGESFGDLLKSAQAAGGAQPAAAATGAAGAPGA